MNARLPTICCALLVLSLARMACGPRERKPPATRPDPASADASTPGTSRAIPASPPLPVVPRRLELPSPMAWLAAGGGPLPGANELSIEADLALARRVLGPKRGVVLFAGGPGSHGVQVRDAQRRGDPLVNRLADLFAPRRGRDASYRPVRPGLADASATLPRLLDTLEDALDRDAGEPFLLYLAAHGSPGKVARENAVQLWGGWDLRVDDLAKTLDEHAGGRRVRMVITSCFAGGFAELVFANADAKAGRAATDRCGFFAATWERESSGCDPDPDRRKGEGYGLHFLHALAGEDKLGQRLPREQLDVDGDGRVSLAEAHARARIAGRGIDLPTTTSERWLRAHAPTEGPSAAVPLPEEEAVIEGLLAFLEKATGRRPTEEVARRRLDALRLAIRQSHSELDELLAREDDAYHDLAARLLARWPVLDDPWHPDFAATFQAERAEIARFLDDAPESRAHRRAQEDSRAEERQLDQLLLEATPWERLVRALDTRELAGRLMAQEGAARERYLELLECERSVP